MDSENKNMDNFFREHLENLEVKPSGNKWKVLSWKLLWQKALFWVASGVILSSVVTGAWLFFQSDSQTVIERHIEKEPIEKPLDETYHQNEQDLLEKADKLTASSNPVDQESIPGQETTSSGGDQNDVPFNIKLQSEYLNGTSTDYNERDEVIKLTRKSGGQDHSFEAPSLQTINPLCPLIFSKNEMTRFYPAVNRKTPATYPAFDQEDMEDAADKKQGWESGFYISPEWVSKTLNVAEPYKPYKQARESGEKNVLSYSLGGNVSFTTGNFFIRSGINYSVFGEDARYLFETNITDSIQSYYNYDTTFRWIFDPPFTGEPWIIGIDTIYIAVYEKVEMAEILKNRYRYFELPLIFGYQPSFGKIGLEIGTGVSLGYLFKANVTLPDPQLNRLIEVNEKSELLRKFNLNYIIQAGIKYRFHERWCWWIRPTYKRNVNSIFEKDYPVEQKFSTFGLQTGIHFRF